MTWEINSKMMKEVIVTSYPSLGGFRYTTLHRILADMLTAIRSGAASWLLLSALISPTLYSQSGQSGQPIDKQTEGAQPAASSGMATGSPRPAQYDNHQRPITAGGFVSAGPVIFQDISEKAGVTTWSHHMGDADKHFILETDGSGVGLIDYDNDGWLDIYFVNGSTFKALDGKEPAPHAALFHNNHDGTFTDVAAKAGVTNDRWGFGVAIADYDNDGWPDIFVANYGKNRLYHNNHNGTFTDVGEKAGITLGNWSAGATWGDYDGDGRLDLFVAGYVHFDRDTSAGERSGRRAICILLVSRRDRELRAARAEGRAGSSLSQQRRRHVYRCEREGRRGGSSRAIMG